MAEVTYSFKGDKVYAIREGKVLASVHVDHVDQLEKLAFNDMDAPPGGGGHPIDGPVEMPPAPLQHGGDDPQVPLGTPGEPCPECGEPIDPHTGECLTCGFTPHNNPYGGMESRYPQDAPSPGIEMGGEAGPYKASITTPSGLTGKVLGKVAGVWGDEVTVRLENGRIVRLPVSKEMKFQKAAAAPVIPRNPIEALNTRLAASVDGTRESLVTRREELATLQAEGHRIIASGVSDSDARAIDEIIVTADHEIAEVDDAIAHLDDEATTAYAPPVPFSMEVAKETTASVGGRDGSWLDETANEMIREAEATDFKKLMDEGPEAFAAELPDVALIDGGVVRQMASSFIRSKTAGTDPAVRDPYETTFLARVEQRRRAELAERKQATHKEAAAQEDEFSDAPDESIFL